MIDITEQLTPYFNFNFDLLPVHPWNKKIKGKERGKTPLHKNWQITTYEKSHYAQWLQKGLNAAVRLKENQFVVDIDPRNFIADTDSYQLVAELFDYFDFEDMLETLPIVRTGGGGHHVYFSLDSRVDYHRLVTRVEAIPGVDFKKSGVKVMAAGSKHPNGEFYEWENIGEIRTLTSDELTPLLRAPVSANKLKIDNYGSLNGTQLQESILDKLDVFNYSDNASWFPILCASHHVTAGQGIDEFVDWSLHDDQFSCEENTIRNRWESLHNANDNYSVGTLLRELNKIGENTNDIKAILSFKKITDKNSVNHNEEIEDAEDDYTDDNNSHDNDESELLEHATIAANNIEFDDFIHSDGSKIEGGAALKSASALTDHSSMEDKMKTIRLINVASIEESIEAQELLINKKIMNQSSINRRLKALKNKIIDSLAEIVCSNTINLIFNNGRHILTEPNGQLWIFHKTHWKLINDEYLGKITYRMLDAIKEKTTIDANEINLVLTAAKGIRMRSSVLTTRLFNTHHFKSIITCANCEVHIQKDGSHITCDHSYKSYQLRKLNVNYDPMAKCPLFILTLEGIFRDYNDTEDIIRHLGEVLGYIIQPKKPNAAWWLFKGPGGDGKSTILKIINEILGDASLPASESILKIGTAQGDNHAFAKLVGKLAIIIEEIEHGRVLNDSGLKMLSENTKMSANPKRKDEMSFLYVGSLIICTNSYPQIRDTSEGTMRRINVIPFNRSFNKCEEEDINRVTNIVSNKEEMSGILMFMLKGYERYMKRGRFSPPRSCDIAKEDWLNQSNNVLRFINENIQFTNKEDQIAFGKDLYNLYTCWCNVNNVKMKGRNNFYLDLENMDIIKEVKYGGVVIFKGGKLITDLNSNEFNFN